MASSAPNKSLVARAAAILTTGEVAGSRIDLNETFNGSLGCQVDFTLGSLTNVILRPYVSMDGTNWYLMYGPAGASLAVTLTASATIALPLSAPGWKFMRVSAQGTGTVTSSSLTLTYRYFRRGTQ